MFKAPQGHGMVRDQLNRAAARSLHGRRAKPDKATVAREPKWLRTHKNTYTHTHFRFCSVYRGKPIPARTTGPIGWQMGWHLTYARALRQPSV